MRPLMPVSKKLTSKKKVFFEATVKLGPIDFFMFELWMTLF